MSAQTFSVVMLAGSLRASELQSALGVPPVCLPITGSRTLLQLWCERFHALPGYQGGVVALSKPEDAHAIDPRLDDGCGLRSVCDPRPWRGMAGLLSDLRPSLPKADVVVVVEASVLPPEDLRRLVCPLEEGSADLTVGADASGEAMGAYAVRAELLDRIKSVGYRDWKEQFLPELHQDGVRIRSVILRQSVLRVRTLDGYLQAAAEIGGWAGHANSSTARGVSTPDQRSTPVRSVVAPAAVVSENALVVDSVVLDGARVSAGAVVSKAVVGPGAVVDEGTRLIGRILAGTSQRGPMGGAAPA